MLPDEVLLEIFDYHRLDALDYSLFGPWEWHGLAHVCQRWRSLIFASPRRLDLRLVYTYKRPVGKTLDCWQALPIALWYPRLVLWRPLAAADEDNVISALKYSDRIREINLTMTSSLLEKLAALVQEPFPALEYLRMGSQEMLGSVVVLPDEFLGGSTPRLRQIDLSGTAFPLLPRLLLSTKDLVSLQLDEIPDAGYFTPVALATGLGATPQLKSLKVHFLSPTAFQDQETPHPRLLDRVVLPTLADFQFRGDSEYLEDLVSRLSAPLLEMIEIAFFDRLTFDIPQLSQFLDLTQRLGSSPYLTSIWLWERGFSITHYFPHPSPRGILRLQISCGEFAKRMASLTHINRQLSPLVAGVRRLEIEAHRPSSAPADEVNPVQWLELFGLFVSVRRLELTGTLVPSMAAALEQSAGRRDVSSYRGVHSRAQAFRSHCIRALCGRRVLRRSVLGSGVVISRPQSSPFRSIPPSPLFIDLCSDDITTLTTYYYLLSAISLRAFSTFTCTTYYNSLVLCKFLTAIDPHVPIPCTVPK
ncbi:hypothetical protein EDB92DRAFT_606668 [Lactarius akahatsu]|uniref:F-box domain-containing protein n=1 Tax=Lactarius akahatsu TaxID=416441 RepID=A0AAD4Q2G0_9AGAM|nr:hypothetical protein EDB92DRAFT_606668 [Lactarius akahatsu]